MLINDQFLPLIVYEWLVSCQMGNYIHRVTLFKIGNTIQEAEVTMAICNYICRVN